MTPELKTALKLYIPLILASVGGYYAFSRKYSWQVILLVFVAIAVITWILTGQTVKLIEDSTGKPPKLVIPPGETGTVPASFSALNWATRIKDDVYNPWYKVRVRDNELYESLYVMNTAQLKMIYNAWRDNFYNLENETVQQAINDEWIGYPLKSKVNEIITRFDQLT